MNIHPIKTEEGYNKALARIEKLWEAKPDSREGDELEILITLVEAYEEKHHRIDPPDPIEAIKFRMEQLGMQQTGLVEYLGSASRVSEILHKKRKLSLEMIRKLYNGLGIPLEILIKDYPQAM